MSVFGKKKQAQPKAAFDPKTQKAVLRCSICTGEQVAGFKDLQTGRFTDVMLIRTPDDLERFQQEYGIESVAKEY